MTVAVCDFHQYTQPPVDGNMTNIPHSKSNGCLVPKRDPNSHKKSAVAKGGLLGGLKKMSGKEEQQR